MIAREYLSHERTDNGYMIHTNAADIMIVFMSDDVIRIRVSFAREFPEKSYALITTAWPDDNDELFAHERTRINPPDVPCDDAPDSLTFTTRTHKLVMHKKPLSFTLYDMYGQCIYRDLPGRAYERDYLGRVYHYSAMDREHDHFYGFGEKSGHLDKAKRRLRMSPKDAIGHDPENGDPMYKHIPFYIRINDSTRQPVGMFYDNSHDCVFDMGQEISGYWERYCYYCVDGGDINLFIISGATVKDIITRYTWLTGRTILPTKQSLGFCMSTMYYAELEANCDEEIYRVIDKFRREDIPIDNFWLASGYSSGENDGLRYTFNWNKKRFPEPEKFFANMNARGINVIPNLKPGVLTHHPYAEYYSQRGAFIRTPDGTGDYYGQWWGGLGRFIDFTSEHGREAWRELLENNILRKGTKTVWNDNCEFDGIEDREALCSSGTMRDMKIIHSNMMAYVGVQAIHNVYPNERPYVINRAGYAGIQRYAQVWGGDNLTDWRTLKYNVATIMGMGLSGCANMGCDVGGFAGHAPGCELFLRWIQNGIFQPRFVINSANDDNTVTQPFMYPEILSQVREAFSLRYAMLPYLYSLMHEAYTSGLPVWRPLFVEFPDDVNTYSDTSLSFMFGASVLVANVLDEGAKTRRIYLPAGCKWYDMCDNFRTYDGGQVINYPVTSSTIPMFLRGNGIFITTSDIKRITQDTMKHIELVVAADDDCEFAFYDDDGHTQDYMRGVYSLTQINVHAGDRTTITFTRSGSYETTIEHVTLRLISKNKGAYWVSVDGQRIPRYIVSDDYESANEGWYYDMTDKTICAKFNMPGKEKFSVVVSTEKFDLIGMNE